MLARQRLYHLCAMPPTLSALLCFSYGGSHAFAWVASNHHPLTLAFQIAGITRMSITLAGKIHLVEIRI
jgi:hypothetical protein